ncbi:MAG: hypothetical protein LQ342_001337 [Letrouitia transgressa]|nr:MAG: hypothetical protein LQ342_001337 [Letrouitia transgressa]
MFHISIPLESWLVALSKIFYDRELAVSERRIKPASIFQNSSLILGKQIIHILPDGHVNLPILVNQTTPIRIDLVRFDFEKKTNETITITKKEIKKIKKHSAINVSKSEPDSAWVFHYAVKKIGLYQLQRVVDESNLEVRRMVSEAVVVRCPSAAIRHVAPHKCKGELSNFHLEVDATPPVEVKYSKTINGEEMGYTVLTIPSELTDSPLETKKTGSAIMSMTSEALVDISWALSQSTAIPLNESLGVSGSWLYQIHEVRDGCGNVVGYSDSPQKESKLGRRSDISTLEQVFFVHERPKATLHNCDSQNPLKVAKGESKSLPLRLSSADKQPETSMYQISYIFTPQQGVDFDQEHLEKTSRVEFTTHYPGGSHEIHDPGLYTLSTVRNEFCEGDILEPSSCLLLTPPEPNLSIQTQPIADKCAGRSSGIIVDLDLVGTPPFRISYSERRTGGGPVIPKFAKTDLLHSQLQLKPEHAGHYRYEFVDISDAVYKHPRSLNRQNLVVEQDVKPLASARLLDPHPARRTCIGETVALGVQLSGEAPWKLEYEVIHNGRRGKKTVENIEEGIYTLETDQLNSGGDFTIALTSVTDQTGCKSFLEQETKIQVALQRPKAAFGFIEGKQSIHALEGKKLEIPLRLQGDPPWTIKYRNLDFPDDGSRQRTFYNSNDRLETNDAGVYELTEIKDAICPGSVDASLNVFKVAWIPRPAVHISDSTAVEAKGGKYVKNAVCEGDEDAVGISFTGTPPFAVEYTRRARTEKGSPSTSLAKFSAGLNVASIKMETSKAGLYDYTVDKLGDSSYNYDPRKFLPLKIEQRVHSNPTARFTHIGKTYKYCLEDDAGGENVPITLSGLAPFYLEIGIKHHSSSKQEVLYLHDIEGYSYNLHIPHKILALGTHIVTIRRVRDAHGCDLELASDAPHVQVSVAEVPSITALEPQEDFCVGDRISFILSGIPPFNVYYTFQNQDRKAAASNTNFRRLAEKPGDFRITAVSDQKSTEACKARTDIVRTIHEMPSARISKGKVTTTDIHEGGQAEILFEFGGTPPFEFTYTRSENVSKGKKSQVLETKSDISYEHQKVVLASDEGVYEVISIKDKYCAFSTQTVSGKRGQKLLMYP